MGSVENIITENLSIWSSAVQSKSSAGRGTSGKRKLYGVKKLRGLILDLAVRGLLVPQVIDDEPASVLVAKILNERDQLVKDGKIKKPNLLPEITNKQKTFALPNGWHWIRLGELVEMYNGRAFKTSEWTNDGVPIVRIQNLNSQTAEFNYFNGEVGANNLIDNDSFLISWSGTPGTSFGAFIWNRGPAALNQHINNCIFHLKDTNLAFMKLAVNGCMNHFISMAQGAVGLKHVTKGTLNNAVIALPPQAEQHRIVAKVDELMALCDSLEQQQEDSIQAHETLVEALLDTLTNVADADAFQIAWQRISAHFDALFTTVHSVQELKETIRQLSIQGKLVPQNANNELANELLKRIAFEKDLLIKDKRIKGKNLLLEISDEEKSFDLPKGWEWCRIREIMSSERDISYGVIKLEQEPTYDGIPTLRCSDVKSGFIDLSGIRTVSPDVEKPYKRTRLIGGEVLVNIRGTLGGVALVHKELAGFNIAREVAMLPVHTEIEGSYLVNVILSPFFWEKIESNLKGIAYKGLNLNILRDLVIPIPPLAEQHRIVAKVDELMALCDQLKESLEQAQQTQIHLTDAVVENAL